MHPTFKQMKETNCDAVSFLPEPEHPDNTIIQGLTYREKGENIGGSILGHSYDIITFRHDGDNYVNMDHFEAVLVCPYTYGEKLMKEGNYGFIAKKTTTSIDLVNTILNKINDLMKISEKVKN